MLDKHPKPASFKDQFHRYFSSSGWSYDSICPKTCNKNSTVLVFFFSFCSFLLGKLTDYMQVLLTNSILISSHFCQWEGGVGRAILHVASIYISLITTELTYLFICLLNVCFPLYYFAYTQLKSMPFTTFMVVLYILTCLFLYVLQMFFSDCHLFF
jgi:hypothetical protein